VDPMADKFPSITAYAYCYNKPIDHVDRFGLWGEKKAKRKHAQAVKRYGEDRVGNVHYNIKNKEYGFRIYDTAEDKNKDGKKTGNQILGIQVWDKGSKVYSNRDYRAYKEAFYRRSLKQQVHTDANGTVIEYDFDFGFSPGISWNSTKIAHAGTEALFNFYSDYYNKKYFAQGSLYFAASFSKHPVPIALSGISMLEAYLATDNLINVQQRYYAIPNPQGIEIVQYTYYSGANGVPFSWAILKEIRTGTEIGKLSM